MQRNDPTFLLFATWPVSCYSTWTIFLNLTLVFSVGSFCTSLLVSTEIFVWAEIMSLVSLWKAKMLQTNYPFKILIVFGREPWSSGYGTRLVSWWLWVRIPAPHAGWIFSDIFFVRVAMFGWKDENKRKRERPIKKWFIQDELKLNLGSWHSSICTYHPEAPGSNPSHNMYAFSIFNSITM